MEAKIEDGVVDIRGKQYRTVARRIHDFREAHQDYSITTKILSAADLVTVRATIKDASGRTLATGLAEEMRGSTNINKTSALENAETSAVGRALAFFGLGGTEIASADEVANDIKQQQEFEQVERLQAHNSAVRDHIESIVAIKTYLANGEYGLAYEALAELSEDDRKTLWLAPTKGGIWTTAERKLMQSDEMTEARKAHHGETA